MLNHERYPLYRYGSFRFLAVTGSTDTFTQLVMIIPSDFGKLSLASVQELFSILTPR